ncbi:hypothetical protein I582_02527 [Enterococcus casseliflavus ATCC 49996]|nr:hypothetical protein UAM_03040 [Enterococcus casseliflavus ATCC 49996]EOU05004.1 hypothetical protein I582_02527 [Enterococcus casseliflavus ATCC 49996]
MLTNEQRAHDLAVFLYSWKKAIANSLPKFNCSSSIFMIFPPHLISMVMPMKLGQCLDTSG